MSVPRTCLLLLALASSVRAEGPTLDHLFPGGARRGQTAEVQLSGKFSRWPVRVWVDTPGVAFEAMPEKGKLVAKVDAQAVPGPRLIRVLDDEGASAPRPFLIGTVPEVVEKEPNDEPRQAQALESLPVLVNGRLGKRGDVDVFAVALKRGQTLVASVEGHRRLGSPMDAVIQVVSPDGIVCGQVDDSPGLDPAAAFEVPADGRYLIRVFAFPETPDSSIAFAGGDAFIYRLTLTTSAYLENVLPLVGTLKGEPDFEAIGWNLSTAQGPLREDRIGSLLRVWHPDLAGDVAIPVVDHASHHEGAAGPLSPPFTISGSISRAEDVDRIRIALQKGRAYRFRVEARAIGSPLDPVLKVLDGAGKLVAEQDDGAGRDVELDLTAPAEGVFEAALGDLNGQGSGRHLYALTVAERSPEFAIEAAEDRLTLTPGKSATLSLKVVRRDGFDQEIGFECPGLPAGVRMNPTKSEPKGKSAAAITLTFEAASGVEPFAGPIQVRGRAGDLSRPAVWAAPKLEQVSTDKLWLTILPTP